MNSDRIKEIQQQTAYPESYSVLKALNQVWHETAVPARADALKEAAAKVWAAMKHGGLTNADEICGHILALIDQPQEDVCCEWVRPKDWDNLFMVGCNSYAHTIRDNYEFCPHCGRTIKVKE